MHKEHRFLHKKPFVYRRNPSVAQAKGAFMSYYFANWKNRYVPFKSAIWWLEFISSMQTSAEVRYILETDPSTPEYITIVEVRGIRYPGTPTIQKT